MADAKKPGPAADDEIQDLMRVAHAAAVLAHAPYSEIQVGAALVSTSGEVFTGCNVENASFGLTICAERAAVAKAISAGVTSFRALAVASSKPHPLMPCGACRQVLREFATDLRIHVQGKEGPRVDTTLAELLPRSFGPADVG
jgi:cytidine deaminase